MVPCSQGARQHHGAGRCIRPQRVYPHSPRDAACRNLEAGMGRDGAGLALKRKSLQDLADEGLRQCNPASSCSSPASWMHDEELGCSRKAARAHATAAAASDGLAAVAAGPLGPGAAAAAAAATPPGQRAVLGQLPGSLPPVLRSSVTCSLSVFCSSSFGAMEEGSVGQEGESPSSNSWDSQGGAPMEVVPPAVDAAAAACSCGGAALSACACLDVWQLQWQEIPDDILRKVNEATGPSHAGHACDCYRVQACPLQTARWAAEWLVGLRVLRGASVRGFCGRSN